MVQALEFTYHTYRRYSELQAVAFLEIRVHETRHKTSKLGIFSYLFAFYLSRG